MKGGTKEQALEILSKIRNAKTLFDKDAVKKDKTGTNEQQEEALADAAEVQFDEQDNGAVEQDSLYLFEGAK